MRLTDEDKAALLEKYPETPLWKVTVDRSGQDYDLVFKHHETLLTKNEKGFLLTEENYTRIIDNCIVWPERIPEHLRALFAVTVFRTTLKPC